MSADAFAPDTCEWGEESRPDHLCPHPAVSLARDEAEDAGWLMVCHRHQVAALDEGYVTRRLHPDMG